MKKLAAAAAILVLACAREHVAKKTPAPPTPPVPPNLLELQRGAAVVSRTGEAMLLTSAARAIDGDSITSWISPPDNPKQTLVFSLPGRATIDQIGLTTSSKEVNAIASAKFELSVDGVKFTDAGTYTFKSMPSPQIFPITPRLAQYIKVTSLTGHGPYLGINTVYMAGKMVDVAKVASIDGAWKINDMNARFALPHAAVADFALEGGPNRFVWMRPNREYGLAFITVTPDGQHLSGIVWHEEAIQAEQFWANDWLGDRESSGGQAPTPVLRSFLERFGYFPLYALEFDDKGHLTGGQTTIDEIAPLVTNKTRFVAHELLRDPSITKTELESLRGELVKRGVNLDGVEFLPMGNKDPRRPATNDLTRAMYSTVEIQIRR